MATRSFAYLHAVHECEYGQVYRHVTGIVVMAIRPLPLNRYASSPSWAGVIVGDEPKPGFRRPLPPGHYAIGRVDVWNSTGWEGPLDDGR